MKIEQLADLIATFVKTHPGYTVSYLQWDGALMEIEGIEVDPKTKEIWFR